MDSPRELLMQIKDWLAWLPNWLLAVIILAIAIALVLYASARILLRRALAQRHPYLRSVLTRVRGATLVGMMILAVAIALPVAPLDPVAFYWLAHLLVIAVVGSIGWITLTALDISANFYLLRFRVDTADNLLARKHVTQVRVLLRSIDVLVILITVGAALMTFEPVRQYGVSLFASAGVAGIVAGLAARPVLSNLFAGVQIAITQPIRIDDAVIVEGEFGTIEEITSTYVVVKIWDWRRMIVPLTYIIEKPFQNWTRESSALIAKAVFYLDYRAPFGVMRDRLEQIVQASKLWDGQVCNLQVTDCKEQTMEVRCIMSAVSSGRASDLAAYVRETMIDFLQREHPEALPRQRSENIGGNGNSHTRADEQQAAPASRERH
jgi:small-conductance mechanosensitive channel